MGWKKWNTESKIFYAVLVFNIVLLLTIKYYPSMDGPSHLYNANLIRQFITGNASALSNYFILNKDIIPNWISYFILVLFKSFLPGWIAEKNLLIVYLTGISISFRLLIHFLCPKNPALSIFIFPFAYSFLFHLGFYNYCFSFILLFYTLYYWLKHNSTLNFYKVIILCFLLIFTYLSAILTFFMLEFCLGMLTVVFFIRANYQGCNTKEINKNLLQQIAILLLASLPCLIASGIFISNAHFFPTTDQLSSTELVKWVNDIRCIIVYNYKSEEILTGQFLHIFIAVFCISLFLRFYKQGTKFSWKHIQFSDTFLIPCVISLVALFVVPNGASAGAMSDRFCLILFMFSIIWVASQPLPKKITNVLLFIIVPLHISLLLQHHEGSLKNLNTDAITISDASKYIEANSVVLPVNMSDNWLEPHFSNYLGADKPLIILENYEASVGWFPIHWNNKAIPRIKLGDFDRIQGIEWPTNIQSAHIKQIDFVFISGNISKLNDQKWTELKDALNKYYKLTYQSENKYVAVFKKI